MQTFIEEVVDKVWERYNGVDNLTFVLPSKRAGNFLKETISKKTKKTIFAPTVYSIEEFVEQVANISYASSTEQIFELYRAYLEAGTYEKESFDSFLSWGETLLQDINEVDRYLVDAKALFSNLGDIQEINHWSAADNKTALISKYIQFWKHLLDIYTRFNSNLLEQHKGHQGLVYRTAVAQIDAYLNLHNSPHIFLGFNALNTSESTIIQKILSKNNSDIFWDIDPYFLDDVFHDAGLFIRSHANSWPVLQGKELMGLSRYYLDTKKIDVVGIPKNVAQAKYAGKLLESLHVSSQGQLNSTALVLGDESLLSPLLNAIPEAVTAVNVTMGQKLELTPLAGFFNGFLKLYEDKAKKGWYYKDFISFLTHPFTALLCSYKGVQVQHILDTIHTNNWSFIKLEDINYLVEEESALMYLLFANSEVTPSELLDRCVALVVQLKEALTSADNQLALEQLYVFNTLFVQIGDLMAGYRYITSIKGLVNLLQQLLAKETLDFKGNPLDGLQVMGMLESRNLDFDRVILSSVNEGILPSGKSNNSFIPFDLKIAHKLPTYKEKDAVYTYHFYRLLQRAKEVYILYNTEPSVVEGSEKSRLITQLLTDENRKEVVAYIAAPELHPMVTKVEEILKSEVLATHIAEYATKGYSPSSLSNYIRNPIDFYKQNLLGIRDTLAVEEDIASNTFGTIVHDSLEELYSPFVGQELTEEKLSKAKESLTDVIGFNFKKTYLDGDITTGKNYISYYVIHKYITKLIDAELEDLKQHTIKIVALEQPMQRWMQIPGIDKPVLLKGKLDRVDEVDGVLRILDYKTGKVEKRHVEISEWDTLTQDYAYSKAFQLLCYAYMYAGKVPNKEVYAGILSLKNTKDGVLLFAKKDGAKRAKNHLITQEILNDFEQVLQDLILEIHDKNIPLVAKVT